MKGFKICAIAGLVLALAAPAWAITLVYEEGPYLGQSYVGPIVMKYMNFDVGTVYPTYAVGTSHGYSGPPNVALVGGGVATLDGLGATPPPGVVPGLVYPTSNEDSWGICRLTTIKDPAGWVLWTPAVKGREVTMLFRGEQDFYVKQESAVEQYIDGVGFALDFYEEPLPSATSWDPTGGTAVRGSATTYPTITEGNLVLSLRSVPGFINGPGEYGGLATEFESRFKVSTLTGEGDVYADVVGGSQMAIYDSNNISTAVSVANGFPNTDMSIAWTMQGTNVADWLVTSEDPIHTTVLIPEPVTTVSVLLAVAGIGGYLRRRIWA